MKKESGKKSDVAKREEEVLKFWNKNNIFQKSLDKPNPYGEYVFYDGPPFATGLPHYGSILPSVIKDAIPRYQTMRGKKVERRWGWDCHGLPIENMIEKELGISGKKQIEEIGIDTFNKKARESVLRYAAEWKKTIDRIGRWVDFDGAYMTMNNTYIESVWWSLKKIYEKELLYEGTKILPYCARCETPISNAEIAMDHSYQDITDISVYVKFRLKDEKNTSLIAWTTTPWTLPGNTALAIVVNETYVRARIEGTDEVIIVAKKLYGSIEEVLKKSGRKQSLTRTEEVRGEDLVGKEYLPLFDHYKNQNLEHSDRGWKVYAGDFVTIEEGTGIVHIAPGFGEEDKVLSERERLPVIIHITPQGTFAHEFGQDGFLFYGLPVKAKKHHDKTDIEIIKYLSKRNLLFAKQIVAHAYPHCHRCETPLYYYALPSWFINIQKVKKRILDLNEHINWYPEHLKHGRFQHSVETAPDWNISRNRYWASPLPIWKCTSCISHDVIGSLQELYMKAPDWKGKLHDLHRPYIDEVTYPCTRCSGEMVRIPEVVDCWVESGSMPFAQVHYPMENEKLFKENFPAQFITEYIAQTRTWFYYTHALSTILFDSHAFENVLTTGTILASDGEKMSKSKQNFPDPGVILDTYGADALRLYLIASPVMKAEDLNFNEEGVAEMFRKVILTFENIIEFYELFKGDFRPQGTLIMDIDHPLDQWLILRVDETIERVTKALDTYAVFRAVNDIEVLLRDMSQWYVRRSRERFKSDDILDKEQAVAVLGESILSTVKMLAPLAPFLAERSYQRVLGNNKLYESVHLDEWPKTLTSQHRVELLVIMQEARNIVEAVHAARAEAGIRVRQPLSEMQAFTKGGVWKGSDSVKKIILEEVNVRKFDTLDSLDDFDAYQETIIKKKVGDVTIALNIEITEELRREGWVREFVRQVNKMRKENGLTIHDRATIRYITEGDALKKTLDEFKPHIEKNILGTLSEGDTNGNAVEMKINDILLTVTIEKQ